jgi:phosphonatase-like hydrolase
MKVQLAVFDLAGTTVKDERFVHKILQDALKKHEVDVSLNDVNEVMGIPKPTAIQKLLEKRYTGSRLVSLQWVEAIHQYFVKRMIDFYLKDGQVAEKEGVSETFAELKKMGVKIFVDTGFDRDIASPLLKRMGWQEKKLIDGVITSDGDIPGRPFPDMIYRAMKMSGVFFAQHVAKIGDTPSDLQQGTAAGCGWVIGVTTGAFSELQLKFEPHTHLIKEINEVLSIFQEEIVAKAIV